MKNINVIIIAVGNVSYKTDAKAVLDDYFNFYNANPVYIEQDIHNPKNAHPSWLKMISYEYLDNTDPVLCWDLDLLPINRSINIFEYINTNKINMCVDNSVILTNFRFNQNFRYNGGLISFPYSYKDFCSNIYYQYAPGERPSYEQYYLNDEIVNQKIDIHELPLIFNGMLPPQGVNSNIFQHAFCKHYTWGANDNQKIDLIAKHKSYYFNNLHI
jgi:hypothetical protein